MAGPQRVRRTARLSAVLPAALLVLSLATPPDSRAAPARHSGPGRLAAAVTAAPDPLAALQAQTTTVAHQIELLTRRYRMLSARARAAADGLARAFASGAAADRARDLAQRDLARAGAERAAVVRAVYAEGGPTAVMLSVLASDTPEDLFWGLSTMQEVTAGLLRRADGRALSTAADAARSAAVEQAATASDLQLAAALGAVQDDTAGAQRALDQARADLAGLSARARSLAVARAAAAALSAAAQAEQAERLAAAQHVTALGIPAGYQAAYRAAALTCPGLRWSLLAAIGQVESGHGRNDGPSSAGAIGPMQFEPATFALYAVDGDADGVSDPWDYRDAIFTAARYLCVSGARGGSAQGVQRAVFTYNHAQWYVDLVLATERAILAVAQAPGTPSGPA